DRATRRSLYAALSSARPVAPVADLNEKAFLTHAGKVTPWNANVGQFLRSNLTFRPGGGDGALPERGFRVAGELNSLYAVSITLSHPDGRIWRSFEWN